MCKVTPCQANNEEKEGHDYTELLVIEGHGDAFGGESNEGCISGPPASKRSGETHAGVPRSWGLLFSRLLCRWIFAYFLLELVVVKASKNYSIDLILIPQRVLFQNIHTYTLSKDIFWLLWGISIVPALERWKQDYKFKVTLDYTEISYIKSK